MNLVLLGAPGAGKGSLAELLKEELKIAHISTGDILREQIKQETELGKEAKKFIDDGQLVPDELVTKLIENKLKNDPSVSNGYMLDGYPRTNVQAEELDRILKNINKPLDYALYLQGTLEIILQRLTGRRVCRQCGSLFHVKNRPPQKEGVCDNCGGELYQRPDDNEETIKKRMEVYMESTRPIIDYYESQGILQQVNGDEESEDLKEQLVKIFDEDGKLNQS